jgi:hypothetical protein
MASVNLPHFHVSGMHALVTFLFAVVMFGSAHLLAAANPENRISQAWIALGF